VGVRWWFKGGGGGLGGGGWGDGAWGLGMRDIGRGRDLIRH